MDDLAWFDLEGEALTDAQLSFVSALRARLRDGLRPYCVERTDDNLLLVLDVDAPEVALVSVGLQLRGRSLRGDRISVHDRSFPPVPTLNGFHLDGGSPELAARAGDLLEWFANRPVVRHEWLHHGQVYADCYLFEDSSERLAQTYRSDLAPPSEEDRLIAERFVHGAGWIQTQGLGDPDRVVRVRGGD
ncbi:hypothetical protein [Agromyces sp. Leaf222]|uniref:hypothetical protein n=1 Tax=Agromyces sp. Leaf222 TaxID=1735688 RepID=UPI0012F7753B|nr:hypothetical protein [Agromyces sp. Leaf222]